MSLFERFSIFFLMLSVLVACSSNNSENNFVRKPYQEELIAKFSRGVVCFNKDLNRNFISWRLLPNDSINQEFYLWRKDLGSNKGQNPKGWHRECL